MKKKNALGIGSVAIILMVAIGIFAISNLSSENSESKAIEAAEKYVARQVYITLGVTCERYDSNVIYKSGDKKLISVKFYIKGSSNVKGSSFASGSYCVYCEGEYAINSTKMMGADHNYKERIEELKALFKI